MKEDRDRSMGGKKEDCEIKRRECRESKSGESTGRPVRAALPHDHGENIDKILEKLPPQEECIQAAEMFKQISDGSRLRIFWFLCHCEECVSNIAAVMEMSDPAVSHHLKLLRKSGLIVSRRDGKEIYYRMADSQQARLVHKACEDMFRISCPSTPTS